MKNLKKMQQHINRISFKKRDEKYNQDILLYNNKIKKYYDELEEELSNIEELDNYIKQCDECVFFE